MNDPFFELPPPAQKLVRQIEATIGEAEPLLSAPEIPPDIAFSLRETRGRYLPDTVAAYMAVPKSQRPRRDESGTSAEDQLLEQLSVLDRATRHHLDMLAKEKRTDLAVNARFLANRFDDRSSEISEVPQSPPPPALAQLRNWLPDSGNAQSIVAVVGAKFAAAFPQFTELGYGGMWGMGPVQAVMITLPQGGGTSFRYTLSAKTGILEPSVAKLVHGTSIQTVKCPVDDWLQSLYDDLEAQARHHLETRNALTRLLQ